MPVKGTRDRAHPVTTHGHQLQDRRERTTAPDDGLDGAGAGRSITIHAATTCFWKNSRSTSSYPGHVRLHGRSRALLRVLERHHIDGGRCGAAVGDSLAPGRANYNVAHLLHQQRMDKAQAPTSPSDASVTASRHPDRPQLPDWRRERLSGAVDVTEAGHPHPERTPTAGTRNSRRQYERSPSQAGHKRPRAAPLTGRNGRQARPNALAGEVPRGRGTQHRQLKSGIRKLPPWPRPPGPGGSAFRISSSPCSTPSLDLPSPARRPRRQGAVGNEEEGAHPSGRRGSLPPWPSRWPPTLLRQARLRCASPARSPRARWLPTPPKNKKGASA